MDIKISKVAQGMGTRLATWDFMEKRIVDWKNEHGGSLRTRHRGRRRRPLQLGAPVHLILKCNNKALKLGLHSEKCRNLIKELISLYGDKFNVSVDRLSIQRSHIHMLVKFESRKNAQDFMRILPGQIAQRMRQQRLAFQNQKLWESRPFTRNVLDQRSYKILLSYFKLNDLELAGKLPYQKERLRGLSRGKLLELWAEP